MATTIEAQAPARNAGKMLVQPMFMARLTSYAGIMNGIALSCRWRLLRAPATILDH
jgi:hypothetical protein